MTSILLLRAVWMVVLLVLANAVSVRCIGSRELDSMLETLRARGYDLFCNAILTSDLRIDLLSFDETANANATRHSFTLFAATDASLFALDMTLTASSYTDTLRFHVVPRRLSLSQLRLLPDGYFLPTLLPKRRLLLTRRPASSLIAVSGVDIAFPGLFYGRNVAVHGLAGILTLRSNSPPSPAPVLPPIRSADHRYFSPRSSPEPPVPESVWFNITSRQGYRPPVEAPAPEPTQAPENGRVDAPEPEPDWTVHPPVNLGGAPFVTPAVSPPRYPDSAISYPPEGYSDAVVPAPVGLELWVRNEERVSWMETEGEMETPEKSEPLDGVRNCENEAVGLKDHVSHDDDDDHVRHKQCYAA